MVLYEYSEMNRAQREVCLVSELEIRQQRGILPAGALLLTVPDPQEHVGSGGATLNALLVAAEHLSARDGYTVSPRLEAFENYF